jgi:hypothetical protein
MMESAASTATPHHGNTSTRVFTECLERVNAGTPTLLLYTGEVAAVRETVALLASEAPLSGNARVIEVEPDESHRYDPVAGLARAWRKGVRRVSFESRQRDIAWSWLGLVPFWGNLVAAVYETIHALRPAKQSAGDPTLLHLLRTTRQRSIVAVIFDLPSADRAAAARICSALQHAPSGSRLLIAGGIPHNERGSRAPILDFAAQLPPDRVMVHRILRDDAVLQSLSALSAAVVAALGTAAALGDEFDGNTVAGQLGIDELDAEDRLAVAVAAGLIRVLGSRDLADGDITTLYRFESAELRSSLLARRDGRSAKA